MNRNEFIAELTRRLSGLPKEDIQKSADYYAECIDDRLDDGMTEQVAVADLGSMDEIVSQILRETLLIKLAKEKVTPKRTLKWWEILIVFFTAPIWIPVGLSLIATFLGIYITIWSIVILVYAFVNSFGITVILSLIAVPISLIGGDFLLGVGSFGIALLFAGLCILGVLASIQLTKGVIFLSKQIVHGVKRLIIGKGNK